MGSVGLLHASDAQEINSLWIVVRPHLNQDLIEILAREANIVENHPDYRFYTSEDNDGHEDRFCRNRDYNPNEFRPPTGRESWQKWQFMERTLSPCWLLFFAFISR